jgi:hypothetical protein
VGGNKGFYGVETLTGEGAGFELVAGQQGQEASRTSSYLPGLISQGGRQGDHRQEHP